MWTLYGHIADNRRVLFMHIMHIRTSGYLNGDVEMINEG